MPELLAEFEQEINPQPENKVEKEKPAKPKKKPVEPILPTRRVARASVKQGIHSPIKKVKMIYNNI